MLIFEIINRKYINDFFCCWRYNWKKINVVLKVVVILKKIIVMFIYLDFVLSNIVMVKFVIISSVMYVWKMYINFIFMYINL